MTLRLSSNVNILLNMTFMREINRNDLTNG